MKLVLVALGLLCVAPTLTRAEPIELAEVRQNLFATCFPSDKEGWMVGELGRIFHTRDGGQTWDRQDAGTKRPFLAMACLDANTAWIAGKDFTIADVALGPIMHRCLDFPIALPALSNLKAWREKLKERPAFKKATGA